MAFEQNVSEEIWKLKYQHKSFDGEIYDKTIQDTWWRIADALAEPERNYGRHPLGKDATVGAWAKTFYDAMEDFKFIPAGRIVSGAGTGRNVTLNNCYVMGNIEDDMTAIFDNLKEAALTMQQGGGIGYCFSTIRPSGAHVKGVDADASGPLTFMDVWDAMCRTIMSAGSRRGAMMATMHCWHPDIEKFIEAKRDPARLRMFNMSVLITDDFMEAVRNNDSWDLIFDGKVYKTIQARSLWDKIMISTYEYAEPGVIFIDRINNDNNLNYMEEIVATNPCGEQPLPPYGACLLGSLNLSKFVIDPFGSDPKVDYRNIELTIGAAIRMMDNVNDVTNFPLEKQRENAMAKRRIGLGVTGLADMLVMLNLKYGSPESIEIVDNVMRFVTQCSYVKSAELSMIKGSFPAFKPQSYVTAGFVKKLDKHIQDHIRNVGVRNSHLISIAPTGTISLMANNVSSGIEPIFAPKYERKVLLNDGSHRTEVIKDYAVHLYEKMFPNQPLNENFVTAQTITPSEHIAVQAAAQKWVDTSISKTTNVPEDISFDAFKDVYMEAWNKGCKGCTTYRPNDVTGSVLTAVEDKPEVESDGGACMITQDPETGQMIRTCE